MVIAPAIKTEGKIWQLAGATLESSSDETESTVTESRRPTISRSVPISRLRRPRRRSSDSAAGADGSRRSRAVGSRRRRHHRLRLAVQPAHRAARARAPRLLRADPARRARGARSARCSPKGFILSGGPASVYAPDAPLIPQLRARLGQAHPRHLLRHAAAGASARRRGRAQLQARVRPGRACASAIRRRPSFADLPPSSRSG